MPVIPSATADYRKGLQDAIVQADTIKLFDYMLTIGVEEWASDIHVEPFENFGRIRIRIDGWLQELIQYPKTYHLRTKKLLTPFIKRQIKTIQIQLELL